MSNLSNCKAQLCCLRPSCVAVDRLPELKFVVMCVYFNHIKSEAWKDLKVPSQKILFNSFGFHMITSYIIY